LDKIEVEENKKDILDLEKNKKGFGRIIERAVLVLVTEKLE